MSQVAWALLMYGVGVLPGSLLRRRIPFAFICVTGFLWGSLAYTLAALLTINLALPLGPALTGAAAVMLLSVLLIGLQRGSWRGFSAREAAWLFGGAALTATTAALAVRFNYTQTSDDSIAMIFLARLLTFDGLSELAVQGLALRSALLPLLYTAGNLTNSGYLAVAQPLFALSLLASFLYLAERSLRRFSSNRGAVWGVVLLAALALFSSEFLVFQSVYIHMNLPAGAYLLVAFMAFWLAEVEDNRAWLVYSTAGWLGFSLARTEAPLFSVMLLVLGLSLTRWPYRTRLAVILPFAGILLLWYTRLLLRMGNNGTYILNPQNIQLILAALGGLVLFTLLSRWPLVEQKLLPWLPALLLAGMCAALGLLIGLKPGHMLASLRGIVEPMFTVGRWGGTWAALAVLMILLVFAPRLPLERWFAFGLPLLLLGTWAMAFPSHTPYRVNWGGSGNRMLTHFVALLMVYALLKLGPGVQACRAALQRTLLHLRKPVVLAGLLLGLFWAAALGSHLWNLLDRPWGERFLMLAVLFPFSSLHAVFLIRANQTAWQTWTKRQRARAAAASLSGGILCAALLTWPAFTLTAGSLRLVLLAGLAICDTLGTAALLLSAILRWFPRRQTA